MTAKGVLLCSEEIALATTPTTRPNTEISDTTTSVPTRPTTIARTGFSHQTNAASGSIPERADDAVSEELVVGIGALILGSGLTALVLGVATRFRLARAPNGRRWSDRPVPVLGGIAISATIVIVLVVAWPANGLPSPATLASAVAVMFVTGFVDDRHPLNPTLKLAIQVLVGVGLAAAGYQLVGIGGLPGIALSSMWIVLVMNALNLIDNMDGVAAAVTATAAIGLTTTSLVTGGIGTIALMAIAGSVTGFLLFNWPEARIYMGDSGSLVLGTMLGSVSLAVAHGATDSFPVSLAVLGILVIPVFDTVFVFTNRLRRGDSPWNGGSDHTAHLLVRRGATNEAVIGGFVAVTAVASLSAFVAVKIGPVAAAPLVVLIAAMSIATFITLSPDALLTLHEKATDHRSQVTP